MTVRKLSKMIFDVEPAFKWVLQARIRAIYPALTLTAFMRAAMARMLRMSRDELIAFQNAGHGDELRLYAELRACPDCDWSKDYAAVEDAIQQGLISEAVEPYDHTPTKDRAVAVLLEQLRGGGIERDKARRQVVYIRVGKAVRTEEQLEELGRRRMRLLEELGLPDGDPAEVAAESIRDDHG